MIFAVIETGGKQYKVTEGQKIEVEKLAAQPGEVIDFRVLLKANDSAVDIGTPYVSGVSCAGKIVEQSRTDKKIVFRYHSKTRYRKKNTHRQDFTKVEITNIT